MLNLPPATLEHTSIRREPIPGSRLRTRAFIKVQDGCDNHCTYCVTSWRGVRVEVAGQRYPMDIHSAQDGGSQEIILTGVHLGSWGNDFEPQTLKNSVTAILMRLLPPLALSSLKPWDIPTGFLRALA